MQKKKGISLIVLVITIIVMIILAGAIILSLNNAGIIDKASEAVDSSNYKQLEQYITSELLLSGWTSGKNTNKEELQDISGVNVLDIKSDGKVVPDTWVIEKDGAKLTIYSTGEMVKGEVKLWDGSSSAPEIKDGNWYIYTPEELKFLADVVNGGNQTEGYKIEADTVVYLMNDLDLGARQENGTLICGKEWTPIGTTSALKFIGTFEGNNHTIRGVYVLQDEKFAGIFGNSHTIQNLTIKDSYVKSEARCAGGIVGVVRTGDVINCHNVNTLVYGKANVGGVIGQTDGINVKKCSNTGSIFAGKEETEGDTSYTGGIVGMTYTQTIVDNCQNYGNISVLGNVVGGIVGDVWGGTKVKNSTNYGEVTSELNGVGGVVGQIHFDPLEAPLVAKVESCVNFAKVKGIGLVGGIAGLSLGDISLCYNEGQVEGKYNIGGIIGQISSSDSTIQNCYNKEKIVGLKGSLGYIGGIVGYVNASSGAYDIIIKNNYNIGQIEIKEQGVTKVGGAIGQIDGTSYTQNNNYYLDTTLTMTPNEYGEIKTSAAMKETTFITLLNTGLTTSAWEIRAGENNGYPVLIGVK